MLRTIYLPLRFFWFFFLFLSFLLQAQNKAEELVPSPTEHMTAQDYCRFLNAVAADDPHGLYQEGQNTLQATYPLIARFGEPGSYHYEVNDPKKEDLMTVISWYDAARYWNWKVNCSALNNPSSTEYGIYELQEGMLLSVNNNAPYFIATSSEKFFKVDASLKSNDLNFFLRSIVASVQSGHPEDRNWGNELLAGFFIFSGLCIYANREALSRCCRNSEGSNRLSENSQHLPTSQESTQLIPHNFNPPSESGSSHGHTILNDHSAMEGMPMGGVLHILANNETISPLSESPTEHEENFLFSITL